ncbi:MAG: MBL fold metallo-hydrolase [Micrococcales bacterium]|nr:MBL fold metallo-hydrolase [Micrococcales bacterium]MCL2666808.1 MBL fold metallo-hydrolase [Micrococcales bacterium]
MRVERHGHSCVVVHAAGQLVVDPGAWSQVSLALDGADAVLATHEHPDHLDVDAVVASGLPVWGPAPVVDLLAAAGAGADRLHPVADGDLVTPAGVRVRVLGEWHELVHPDAPRFANVGYLIDDRVLHPGDAYVTVPDGVQVELAFVPVSGPWLRIADVVDWVRRVRPTTVVPIHDALASQRGAALALQWIERLCDVDIVDAGEVQLGEGSGADRQSR